MRNLAPKSASRKPARGWLEGKPAFGVITGEEIPVHEAPRVLGTHIRARRFDTLAGDPARS